MPKMTIEIEYVTDPDPSEDRVRCCLFAELIRQARFRNSSNGWNFTIKLGEDGHPVLLGERGGVYRVPQMIDCGCLTTTEEVHEARPASGPLDAMSRFAPGA